MSKVELMEWTQSKAKHLFIFEKRMTFLWLISSFIIIIIMFYFSYFFPFAIQQLAMCEYPKNMSRFYT